MEAPKAGQRLRCATCGTEIVVVKAPAQPISCCGATLGQREAATEAKSDG
jgi:ribosomal protein S27E